MEQQRESVSYDLKTTATLLGTLIALAGIYLASLSPFVQSGDSGEMVTAGVLLKVPHPPGYPLYIYLSHLFAQLPWSTPAWRVGLFSVFAQLGAATIFFDLVRRWVKSLPIAALTTMGFCLSPVVWTFATEGEVFALNNFLTLLTLWFVFRYQSSKNISWAYASCFAAGIAFSHHQTSILITFPTVAYFLWLERDRLLRPQKVVTGLGFFVLGLTPYLLLFPLGKENHLLSWGNFSTWRGFFTHITRAEYGTFQMSTGGRADTNIIVKIAVFFWQMLFQSSFWGALAAGFGIFIASKNKKTNPYAVALTIALLTHILVFNSLSNVDPRQPILMFVMMRMWILPLTIVWLLAALGLKEMNRQNILMPASAVILLLFATYNWVRHVHPKSQDDLLEQAGQSLMQNAAPNAIMLIRGDMQLGITRYLHDVRGIRPDLHLVPMDILGYPWMFEKIKSAIPGFMYPGEFADYSNDLSKRTFNEVALVNIARFPIYFPQLDPDEAQTTVNGLEGFIVGFATRVYSPLNSWNLDHIEKEIQPFMNMEVSKKPLYPWHSWEYFVRDRYFHLKMAIAASYAYRANGDPRFLARAEEIFKNVMNESEDHAVIAKMQIAYLYTDLTQKDAKHRERAIQEWKEYLELNKGFSPEATQARQILSELESLAR